MQVYLQPEDKNLQVLRNLPRLICSLVHHVCCCLVTAPRLALGPQLSICNTRRVLPQEALRVVRQRLVEAVSGVAVPRWPSEALLASPRAAAYVARQFRHAVGLLSAVASFSPMLPPGVATQLAVDQILLQQVWFVCLTQNNTNIAASQLACTVRISIIRPVAAVHGQQSDMIHHGSGPAAAAVRHQRHLESCRPCRGGRGSFANVMAWQKVARWSSAPGDLTARPAAASAGEAR